MSSETQEILGIWEQLPASKRVEVADFARFLLMRQNDERWEQIVEAPASNAKLADFLAASRSEGSEPLDLDRL